MNLTAFLNAPDADLKRLLAVACESPPGDPKKRLRGLVLK